MLLKSQNWSWKSSKSARHLGSSLQSSQTQTEGEIMDHIVEIEELMVEELEERTSPGIIIAV